MRKAHPIFHKLRVNCYMDQVQQNKQTFYKYLNKENSHNNGLKLITVKISQYFKVKELSPLLKVNRDVLLRGIPQSNLKTPLIVVRI